MRCSSRSLQAFVFGWMGGALLSVNGQSPALPACTPVPARHISVKSNLQRVPPNFTLNVYTEQSVPPDAIHPYVPADSGNDHGMALTGEAIAEMGVAEGPSSDPKTTLKTKLCWYLWAEDEDEVRIPSMDAEAAANLVLWTECQPLANHHAPPNGDVQHLLITRYNAGYRVHASGGNVRKSSSVTILLVLPSGTPISIQHDLLDTAVVNETLDLSIGGSQPFVYEAEQARRGDLDAGATRGVKLGLPVSFTIKTSTTESAQADSTKQVKGIEELPITTQCHGFKTLRYPSVSVGGIASLADLDRVGDTISVLEGFAYGEQEITFQAIPRERCGVATSGEPSGGGSGGGGEEPPGGTTPPPGGGTGGGGGGGGGLPLPPPEIQKDPTIDPHPMLRTSVVAVEKRTALGAAMVDRYRRHAAFSAHISPLPGSPGALSWPIHFRVSATTPGATLGAQGMARHPSQSSADVAFDSLFPAPLPAGLWTIEVPIEVTQPGVFVVEASLDASFPPSETVIAAVEVLPGGFTSPDFHFGVHSRGTFAATSQLHSLNMGAARVRLEGVTREFEPAEFTVQVEHVDSNLELLNSPRVVRDRIQGLVVYANARLVSGNSGHLDLLVSADGHALPLRVKFVP